MVIASSIPASMVPVPPVDALLPGETSGVEVAPEGEEGVGGKGVPGYPKGANAPLPCHQFARKLHEGRMVLQRILQRILQLIQPILRPPPN